MPTTIYPSRAGRSRRIAAIIQMQLDEHAGRIKKLEAAVFSK
jgi:hypothetical protein